MELKNLNVYFFFLILIGVTIVTFFIFQPFVVAILLAAILAVIFQRPYLFFLAKTGEKRKISAFLTAILAMLLFAGFSVVLIGLVVNEASNLLSNAGGEQNMMERYVEPFIQNINNNKFLKPLGVENIITKDTINQSISQISQGALTIFQKTYQGIAHFLFLVIVMFFTLYYFLVGGKKLIQRITYLSPLRDSHEKILIEKFISISRATVKGTLVVGFVQGGIGGIVFAIAGIPSAVVWAVIMMFLSLIPMVGSSLIWFPAGVIMIILGNIWQGIMILAVGFGVISIIDNFLRPELVGKDTQMHPLMVFFATLGGIGLFGFLGFIIGPIIVALFLSLWDIYAVEFKTQLKRYNK